MTFRSSFSPILIVLLVLATSASFPQERDRPRHAEQDSVHAIRKVDPDSAYRLVLPANLGTVDPLLDTASVMSRSGLQWLDSRTLTDALMTRPGFIIRDQQSIGQYSAPTFRGLDWRSIAVLWDGRPFEDPSSGIYGLQQASPEFLEQMEVVAGPRSFLYASNGSGATLNLVTRNYNSNRPYTRLFYSETGYGYSHSDGTFAQNVTKRLNVTAGYQFQGTDGRFLNSASEAWNIRGKLRYGLTERLALMFSEYFTSTYTEMNGGVDPLRSYLPFDPNQATVINGDSYEKLTRHDLDLSLVGSVFNDTSWQSSLHVYYSNSLREYRDEENRPLPYGLLHNGLFIQQDHRTSWMGALAKQTITTESYSLSAELQSVLRQVEGSPTLGRHRISAWDAWMRGEYRIGNAAIISGFGRVDGQQDNSLFGLGADIRLTPVNGITVFGGISASHRSPNFTEQFWQDSTVSRNGILRPEHHVTMEAGIEISYGMLSSLRLSLAHRRITSPIIVENNGQGPAFPKVLFTNGVPEDITSADVALSLRYWHVLLEGTGTFFASKLPSDNLPRVFLNGGVYIRDEFFRGMLDLKAGVRGWYRSANSGMVFNPQMLVYVPNPGLSLGQAATVDFVLFAHLGNANIHVIWENLPNIRYYATPYFPGLDREFRFGVAWDFWN